MTLDRLENTYEAHVPKSDPGKARTAPSAIAALTLLGAVTTACGASPEYGESMELDSTELALSTTAQSDLPDPSVAAQSAAHPVMVTSGTCRSKGYQPISNTSACSAMVNGLLGGDSVTAEALYDSNAPAAYGCSIGVLPTISENTLLGARYESGTTEQLDAQQCTHNRPCVCLDDTQGASVCQDGAFRPDPNKYYTIRSPNGRYLTAPRRYGDNSTADPVLLSPIDGDDMRRYSEVSHHYIFNIDVGDMVPSAELLQWRFIPKGSEGASGAQTNDYAIVNRGTGRFMSVSMDGYADQPPAMALVKHPVPEAPLPAESVFFSRCDGAQVFLTNSPAPTATPHKTAFGAPHDCCGGTTGDQDEFRHTSVLYFRPTIVHSEPSVPGKILKRTGCMKKSRSCQSLYGADYRQTNRFLCGVFNQLHKLDCEKTIDPPVSMYLPQGWYIEEVTEFTRAAGFDPHPVIVDPIASPGAISDSLASPETFAPLLGAGFATVSNIAIANSAPLVGAAMSLAISLGFEQLGPLLGGQEMSVGDLAVEIDQALNQLAMDLEARTNDLIENGLAENDARLINNQMIARRRYFLGEYAALKELYIGSVQASVDVRDLQQMARDIDDVDDLAEGLLAIVDEYDIAIRTYFNTSPEASSELDSKRTHFALEMLRLAATERLIMESEGILLKAYADDEYTCDELVGAYQMAEDAADWKAVLTDSQAALRYFANQAIRDELEPHVCDSAGNSYCEYKAAGLEARLAEFEFDAEHFSYPIAAQLVFMDGIAQATLDKCHRLRDENDPFRGYFETNTAPLTESD